MIPPGTGRGLNKWPYVQSIYSAKKKFSFIPRLHSAYSTISFPYCRKSYYPGWRYRAFRWQYTRRHDQREGNIKTATFAWRHQYLSSPRPISQLWCLAKTQPEMHRKARRLNSPAWICNAAGNRNEDRALERSHRKPCADGCLIRRISKHETAMICLP
jgi:hypothetical protein